MKRGTLIPDSITKLYLAAIGKPFLNLSCLSCRVATYVKCHLLNTLSTLLEFLYFPPDLHIFLAMTSSYCEYSAHTPGGSIVQKGANRPLAAIGNWSKDPQKGLRVMDWLDAHALEREVLFTAPGIKRRPKALTKMECSRRAAGAIFSDNYNADTNAQRRVGKCSSYASRVVYDYVRRV